MRTAQPETRGGNVNRRSQGQEPQRFNAAASADANDGANGDGDNVANDGNDVDNDEDRTDEADSPATAELSLRMANGDGPNEGLRCIARVDLAATAKREATGGGVDVEGEEGAGDDELDQYELPVVIALVPGSYVVQVRRRDDPRTDGWSAPIPTRLVADTRVRLNIDPSVLDAADDDADPDLEAS